MRINRHFKFVPVLLLVLFLFISSSSFSFREHGGYKPDEIVCEMMPGYSIDIINDLFGTTVKGFQTQTDCYLLATHPGQNAESLAVAISALPEVLYCGVNYYLYAPEAFQRSQPFLEDQDIITFSSQPIALGFELPEVHEIANGYNTRVAVIDGGVNLTHQVFAEYQGVYYGWDYIDNDQIANDEPDGSCSGHGTFVTGVIKLVAPSSEIYCYRVLDTAGLGNGFDVANAILRAVDEGCRIINLSLGMDGVHDAVDEAIKYAERNNIIVTAAAGNDATDSNFDFPFPASREYCIAVAALDSLNLLADFSNYGIKVDLCAPGTGILAPFLGSYFARWNGTSFSAPFVSGQAALILSLNPLLTGNEVENILAESAVNIDELNPEYAGFLGNGMIDIRASVEATRQNIVGDYDFSGAIDILDIIYLINYLYKEGPAPYPILSADIDCSGLDNILDVVYLINYIYKDGPAPCYLN
jgi:hypothetical protein